MLATAPATGRYRAASNPGAVDLPFILEHVALGVLGLDAETLRAVRNIGESNIGVFRDRNAAFHRKHQIVVLPYPQFIDEEGRNIELRDLIHLQTGIVRVADHDLGFASAARWTLAGLCELPEPHLAELAFCFLDVLGSRSRAAAGRLHIGFCHVELAVAQL